MGIQVPLLVIDAGVLDTGVPKLGCSYWLLHILWRSLSIEPLWQYTLFPLSIGMLLARDFIVGIFISSSILLPASLLTRSVIHHPATNSLVTLLARLLMMCITERAQRYLSDTRSDKSSSWSMPTQQTPSEIPIEYLYNHLVTLWRLIAHKASLRYLGVA